MCAHCADGGSMTDKCGDPSCFCMQNKPTAKIRDWTLLRVCDDFSLIGHIEAHPRQIEFKKEHQRTSRLIRIDFTKMEAETQNTLYKLL